MLFNENFIISTLKLRIRTERKKIESSCIKYCIESSEILSDDYKNTFVTLCKNRTNI